FAVVKLMSRSNLVGCSTGMSPGFAPRRTLSTSSAGEQRRRHLEAERLGGRDVDYQFVLGRSLDWQIAGLFAFEDAARINSDLAEHVFNARSIAHQPTCNRKGAIPINRRKSVPCRHHGETLAKTVETRAGVHEDRIDPFLPEARKDLVNFTRRP